jgi:hypothetical protein
MTNLKTIEEILDRYSDYVYYEGDPMRGGISKTQALADLSTIVRYARIDELITLDIAIHSGKPWMKYVESRIERLKAKEHGLEL